MFAKCLAQCLFLLTLVALCQPTYKMIADSARCPHQKLSSSTSLKRSTRSAPAVAAVFAGAAVAVSAAAYSPEWNSSEEIPLDSSEEVTQRLEYIKQEILKRLGLNDAPRVKSQIDPSNLLKYFSKFPGDQETEHHQQPQQQQPSEVGLLSDESYEPNQIVILPVISSSTSVTFNLTSSRLARVITRMILFVDEKTTTTNHGGVEMASGSTKEVSLYSSSQWRKDGINRVGSKQTLEKHLATVAPLARTQVTAATNEVSTSSVEALTFDLTSTMKSSMAGRSTSYLTINSKHFKMADAHIKLEFEEPQVRKKRSPKDCQAGSNETQGCCREQLYVNFTSIGWDNWIFYPLGYNAYYCRGLCNPNTLRYTHTTILQLNPWKVDLCCSPRELSELTLYYFLDSMLLKTTIPNMTVESCDCA